MFRKSVDTKKEDEKNITNYYVNVIVRLGKFNQKGFVNGRNQL